MSPKPLSEDQLVQATFAQYMVDHLKWDESIWAMEETLGPDGTLGRLGQDEVVLTRYLEPRLKALNPGLPDSAYGDAIKALTETSASLTMAATNQEKDALLRDGVMVKFRDDYGRLEQKRLRFFDFDHPDQNHFLVVRELWMQGPLHRRRADIIGFVNGIPLVYIECKNVTHDVQTAYEKNFKDNLDTVPAIFHHNALVILTNGLEAKVGTPTSQFEHFHDWKRLGENEKGQVDGETLLAGVCDKANLLDLFENYLLFDSSGGEPVKILCRNHQFLGVNQAMGAIRERQQRQGKLGVFWHTQGSGKSYSIVYLVRKTLRKIGGNFTFLILTDREELDTQIYGTFAGCGMADNDREPCRAENGEHLRDLLGQHKRVVFTLIQKFNQTGEYSNRDDIIVITDEAHRTQGGTLALNLRNALPNASYLGFTGTPIIKGEEHYTKEVFGKYISVYDFQRAVEDNATVPLYYDARGEYLHLDTKELNQEIADKLAEFEEADADVTEKLQRYLARDYHILTAEKRLKAIAKDFVDHYFEAWGGGKAMFVCVDKVTAVRMHGYIALATAAKIVQLDLAILHASSPEEKLETQRQLDWVRETIAAVIVSQEQGEIEKFQKWGLDIKPHREMMVKGTPEKDFKSATHPFRIAIVCAMWLTGFDVPTLGTLYLDKPLRAHTLMQAIARANRVSAGKTNGLIVDYCGILKSMREALATFGTGGGEEGGGTGDPDPTKPESELLGRLDEALGLLRTFFAERKFSLDDFIVALQQPTGFKRLAIFKAAKDVVNDSDRSRKQFEILARAIFTAFQAAIHLRPQINDYRNTRDSINLLYESLQAYVRDADISHILMTLQEEVGKHIEPLDESFHEKAAPYDISAIDFELLKREFEHSEHKATAVQALKVLVEQRLSRLLERNLMRLDLQERYEKMIAEYNAEKNRKTIEQTFADLMNLYRDMDIEESRAVKSGLDEESLALFDLLQKPDLTAKDIQRLKSVATTLLATLKHQQLNVEHWRDKEATRDAVRQAIHDFLYDDRTGLPSAFEEGEITEVAQRIYKHVYRVYPELPSPVYGYQSA